LTGTLTHAWIKLGVNQDPINIRESNNLRFELPSFLNLRREIMSKPRSNKQELRLNSGI